MPYLNKVQLIGNLGKDPEIRVSPQTGKKAVSFSLATSRRYRDNNGAVKGKDDCLDVNLHILGFFFGYTDYGYSRYKKEII